MTGGRDGRISGQLLPLNQSFCLVLMNAFQTVRLDRVRRDSQAL
jgi:hypothetical protein